MNNSCSPPCLVLCCAVLCYDWSLSLVRVFCSPPQAYKAVVNDATIFKLELPLKQKGWGGGADCGDPGMQDCLFFSAETNCVCVCVCLLPTRVGMKTQPESKCPELLANYCDMLLRKTPLSKKLNSEEIELKLKEVVSLSCSTCWFVFSFSSVLTLIPSFIFSSCSCWCWSTSRIKTFSCVITKLTWPGVWFWTSQPTVRLRRTWWSGSEWVTLILKLHADS